MNMLNGIPSKHGKMPPIYAAVFFNHLNVVEYLLQVGVGLEHPEVKRRDPTAVHLAAALGRIEIIPVRSFSPPPPAPFKIKITSNFLFSVPTCA